jgi:hypothetical protein
LKDASSAHDAWPNPSPPPNTKSHFASGYDITANGFFFTSAEEYTQKVSTCKNGFGGPVEEFEIQCAI